MVLVKPLYQLLQTETRELQWTGEAEQAFNKLKKELMRAPALGLPHVTKPFSLFSQETRHSPRGPYKRALAHFSKQLDEVSKGWPGCLRAVAAIVLNIQEAQKIYYGTKDDCPGITSRICATGTERGALAVSLSVP